jgi:4-hydroxy-tetrahydrodipicolinate reductase
VPVTADLGAGLGHADVLIDFTRPEGTLAHLHGVPRARGQDGDRHHRLHRGQKAEIARRRSDIAIVMAPNMSVGVNVTLKLLEMAAKALATGYDIEVIEAHHRHKVDAPSGTALKMGEVIAEALGRDLSSAPCTSATGVTGERDPSTIGFSDHPRRRHRRRPHGAVRRHRRAHRGHPPSASRATYAQGSLRAVRFLPARTRACSTCSTSWASR